MPSKSKTVRESQKVTLETAISKRQADLKETGLANDAIRKDPKLKQLKAKLRETHRRLDSIAALEKKKEDLVQKKKENAEKKREKKLKAKDKSAEAPAKGGKKEKKEKKKKQ